MNTPINVGILHSLSGTMSFSETPLVDAAIMAIEEINDQGGVLGHTIRPIVEDCRSDAEAYAANARRLYDKAGVRHFFGCWTSASRKAVKAMVEETDTLLWYPVQYEGLEESPNIVYTGNCLNQQIEPAFEWATERFGKTCYLVGSDYIFPRTANRFIRSLARHKGVAIVGESYQPLGAENFGRIVDDIKKLKPAVVFNTINGDSNIAFYYQMVRSDLSPETIPVMAFSIGEVELEDIGPRAVGHYACAGYFQCLDQAENRVFIARYQSLYGPDRSVSDAVAGAYTQPYLWRNLVDRCRTLNVPTLKEHIAGTTFDGPAGTITLHDNHHAFKPALIGRINEHLQFDTVWQSPQWIKPLPWLGLEETAFSAREMIKEALVVYQQVLADDRNSMDL